MDVLQIMMSYMSVVYVLICHGSRQDDVLVILQLLKFIDE